MIDIKNKNSVLDGKSLAEKQFHVLKTRVEVCISQGVFPSLFIILGEGDPASATYVRMKVKMAERLGICTEVFLCSENTSTVDILKKIHEKNNDDTCHGILVQHPLPKHIDERACFDAILSKKDVDGVGATALGAIFLGIQNKEEVYGYPSATPKGVITLLKEYGIHLEGAHVVILGRGLILGKPAAALFLVENATVTLCHSKTKDIISHIQNADIILAALGNPYFVKGSWCKDGAVVVDAGYHAGGIGDVFLSQEDMARLGAYTLVPGGVGPMTISTLLEHVVMSAERE